MSTRAAALSWWVVAASPWLAGCGPGSDPGSTSNGAASAAASVAAASPPQLADADAYAAALVGVARCTLDATGKLTDCPAKTDLGAIERRLARQEGLMGAVALRQLRHPAPAVRHAAAWPAAIGAFRQTAMQIPPEVVALYATALERETDPVVLRNLLDHGRWGARADPRVLAVVMRSLSHADPRVRAMAISVVGAEEVRPLVSRAFDRVAAALSDADDAVRAEACATLGWLDAAERALPLLKARLADPQSSSELRSACFTGLVRSWIGRHEPLHPSAEAYALTLELLNAGRRTRAWPPSRGIHELIGRKPAQQERGADGKTWSERVKGFYDQGALASALEALALDEDASDGSREAAIAVIAHLGERERLVGLAMTLRKSAGAFSPTLADAAAAAARGMK